MPVITSAQAGGTNICAFLDMIARSELGAQLMAQSNDGYNVLVGSTAEHPLLFLSYATHPNVYNAAFDSTAAGRYQELYKNWVAYAPLLQLPDFGPLSQDRLALRQLQEARALPLVAAGRLSPAIAQCAHLWASLPGAHYGQHEQQLADLTTWYLAAGGQLA